LTVDPYGRNWKRGVQLNNRTLEMLEITELRTLDRFGVVPLSLSQGSYNTSVSQSGGTHDGGGALDVRVVNRLTQSQVDTVVWALRKTGFAAWHRLPSQGDWPEHIHAIAIGDKQMSDAAARQVVAYKNGRNGLANNGPDDGPSVSWTEYRQDIDLSYYGPERWDDADFVRFERKVGWLRDVSNLNTPEADTIDASTSLAYAHKNATDAEIAAKSADKKADQILTALGKLSPPA
jgi:hypothetical protein